MFYRSAADPKRAAQQRVAVAALLLAVGAGMRAQAAPPLRLEHLTFLSTHEATTEVRVAADVAVIDEATNKASLEAVDAVWEDEKGRPSLRVRCTSGELDLVSNELLASGDVRGELADGRRFVGPWLRYDPARGVAFTSAPVEILEAGGRVLRGGGLEYQVKQRRLRLTAGARVEERGTR